MLCKILMHSFTNKKKGKGSKKNRNNFDTMDFSHFENTGSPTEQSSSSNYMDINNYLIFILK